MKLPIALTALTALAVPLAAQEGAEHTHDHGHEPDLPVSLVPS